MFRESRNAAAPARALGATADAGDAGAELVPAGRSAGPSGNIGPLLPWERSFLSFPVILNTSISSLQSSSPSFHIANADAS